MITKKKCIAVVTIREEEEGGGGGGGGGGHDLHVSGKHASAHYRERDYQEN
jgi:hypothetical protein